MSLRTEVSEEEHDFLSRCIVFEGSSPEDVAHARLLWSPMYLQPPVESRLVAADIRQRLAVSRPQRSGPAAAAAPGPRPGSPEPPSAVELRQRREERRRYEAMAERRKEIMARLRMRRQQRIEKELLSAAFKPKPKVNAKLKPREDPNSEMEKELITQLP